MAELMGGLDVAKSHSLRYLSNDNPNSDAQCKTLKYRSAFPDRFTCVEQARAPCRGLFPW